MKRYKRMGLIEIARELNKNSVPTARGGKRYGGTIKYVLEYSLYKGLTHYKENKVKNIGLALIERL